MVSGFFLGGLAEGFQNQQQITNAADFNRQRLQLLQQAQQNEQQREMFVRIDKIAADAWSHIEDTVTALKNAGNSNQYAAAAVTPLLNSLIDLKTKAGMKDAQAIYTAQLSTMLAGPSQAQNLRTLEQAKDPYKSQIESLTVQEKQANIRAMQSDTDLSNAARTAGQPAAAGQPSAINQPAAADKGEAFLATLPNDDLREQVKGLAEYRTNPNTFSTRTTKGMTRSRREIMTGLAEQYAAAKGEQYDQAQYSSRAKVVSAFASGPESKAVRSFNVLVSHLDVLKDATVALNNGDTQAFNALKNTIEAATGSPAPTDFNAVKGIVSDELVKAVTGGAGALGDREGIAATVNAANSPAQLAGVIKRYQQLSAGQLEGLKQTYESGTGLKDFDKKLNARTKKYFGGNDAGTDESGKDYSTTSSGTRYRILP